MFQSNEGNINFNNLLSLSHINSPVILPFSDVQLSAAQALDRVISEALSWIHTGEPDITQLYDEELLDLANKFQC